MISIRFQETLIECVERRGSTEPRVRSMEKLACEKEDRAYSYSPPDVKPLQIPSNAFYMYI